MLPIRSDAALICASIAAAADEAEGAKAVAVRIKDGLFRFDDDGNGSAERVASATQQWGLNKFDVPLPAFGALLQEQMLAPFFVFQVFCVALWCLDEYW